MFSNDCDDEVHIIDIKLQGQELMETNESETADENHVNMSISKEDVVLFTINPANYGEYNLLCSMQQLPVKIYIFVTYWWNMKKDVDSKY